MARRAHDPRRGDGLSPTDPRLLGNPLDFLHEDHLREREICVMLDRIAAAESPDQGAAAHAAGRSVKLEGALTGMPVPLHPGAARFYKEKGLKLPQ